MQAPPAPPAKKPQSHSSEDNVGTYVYVGHVYIKAPIVLYRNVFFCFIIECIFLL